MEDEKIVASAPAEVAETEATEAGDADAGLEMTSPREELKEDDDDDDDEAGALRGEDVAEEAAEAAEAGGEEAEAEAAAEAEAEANEGRDESQVFLLHPRFEALSIKSEFSAAELEGLGGPRLLRTAFALFLIQVAWFFCLVLLFGGGIVSFVALGAPGARDGAAAIFALPLVAQIVVLALFGGLLLVAIKGVSKRDPVLCCGLTYLQVHRASHAVVVLGGVDTTRADFEEGLLSRSFFPSLRLMLRRAIISRSGLEASMGFPRASLREHPR